MKIHYFSKARGVTAPIRAILEYANIDYEFVGYTMDEFPIYKPNFPMGSMPIMEFDDGDVICQSSAILIYAAQMSGLYPSNPRKAAAASSIAFCFCEITDYFKFNVIRVKDPDRKAENLKTFHGEFCPDIFGKIEKYLKQTGSPGYSVGESLTFADFVLAAWKDEFNFYYEGKLDKYFENDTMKSIYETVAKAKEAKAMTNKNH